MTGPVVTCGYCHGPAKLVTGADVYPHRGDLIAKRFWKCAPCQAWVGCHPPARRNGRGGIGNGTVPLGRLANRELRAAKNAAHAAFDPLWKSRAMSRHDAYSWLARALRITPENCHIGMFDVDQCRAVVAVVEERARAKEAA